MGARCVLIYFVRACDMNACCKLGPSERRQERNPYIKGRRSFVPRIQNRVTCGDISQCHSFNFLNFVTSLGHTVRILFSFFLAKPNMSHETWKSHKCHKPKASTGLFLQKFRFRIYVPQTQELWYWPRLRTRFVILLRTTLSPQRPPSDIRRYSRSLSERMLLSLVCVDNVKRQWTFSSLQPCATTCCPKVQYSYPVCNDFARPEHNSVYFKFVVSKYVSYWGTDRRPQCVPLCICNHVKFAFQTRRLHY